MWRIRIGAAMPALSPSSLRTEPRSSRGPCSPAHGRVTPAARRSSISLRGMQARCLPASRAFLASRRSRSRPATSRSATSPHRTLSSRPRPAACRSSGQSMPAARAAASSASARARTLRCMARSTPGRPAIEAPAVVCFSALTARAAASSHLGRKRPSTSPDRPAAKYGCARHGAAWTAWRSKTTACRFGVPTR